MGKTLAQADQAVKADKFTVRTTGHAYSITVGAGLILSQHRAPVGRASGPRAKQGSTIGGGASPPGPPPVAIPTLTSFTTCTDAVQALKAVHLVGVCPPAAAAVQLDGGGRGRPRHRRPPAPPPTARR